MFAHGARSTAEQPNQGARSVTRTDLASFAATCYALEADEDTWLTNLSRLLTPWLDCGLGVSAWGYRVEPFERSDGQPRGLAPDLGDAVQRVAERAPDALARRFIFGPRARSVSERIGVELSHEPWFAALQPWRVCDFKALTLIDGAGRGLGFTGPSTAVVRTSAQSRHQLERIGGHILSAFRLRRTLGEIEAVFAPDGKLLEARGQARDREEREALRSAVMAFDRAGSASAEQDCGDVLESWKALVSGRWSLVQSFESDGRRYLLARCNPPGDGSLPGVTALEAHVLLLRAQGASFKLIAYELGLSIASAHALLRRGSAKLGIRSEAELADLFAQGSTQKKY